MQWQVELKHVGSRKIFRKIATLGQASEIVRDYICARGEWADRWSPLGSSVWQGGMIHGGDEAKYYVSYNGRVWRGRPMGEGAEVTGNALTQELL